MSNEFYYNYSNKQFREKIRNCLRTCIKYGYKLKITEYYQNASCSRCKLVEIKVDI